MHLDSMMIGITTMITNNAICTKLRATVHRNMSMVGTAARYFAVPISNNGTDPAIGTCNNCCTTKNSDRVKAASTTTTLASTFYSAISKGVSGITIKC